MLFQMIAASAITATALGTGPQVLLSDNFHVQVIASDVNAELNTRQSGILATQSYVKADCGTNGWQIQLNNSIDALKIYPSLGSQIPRISLNHNFTNSGEFHLRVTLKPIFASYCFASLGGNAAGDQNGGVSFRTYSNGNIQVWASGSEITGAATNLLAASDEYTLDIYVSTPFNGSGAKINARVNGEILDLNGSTAGYNHVMTGGFSSNYITLGAAYGGLYNGTPAGLASNLWLFDRRPFHGVGWWNGDVGPNWSGALPGCYFGQQEISSLSPAYFQERVPFFGTILGTNSCTFGSTNQATMDKQLDYAIAAGIDYIVWDTYPPALWTNNTLNAYGLQMYLTSSRRTNISFCADIVPQTNNAIWTNTKPWYLALFTNSAYFKVLDNRPLFYVFKVGTFIADGTAADLTNKLGQLRTASIKQGSGNPYIVGYCWSLAEITNAVAIFGDTFDAYSRYAGGVAGTSIWNGYRNELSHKYLPEASTGWDPYPRIENGNGNGYPRSPWKYEATPDAIKASLLSARNWVNDYPLSAEVPLVHSYGWQDMAEGGRVVPSLFKGVDRINAFAAVTGGAGVTNNFQTGSASLTHNWTTISFGKTYDYPPVVILGAPSTNGLTPIVTRARNVTRTNFQARVQEWECDDGSHGAETVHWLAIPPGTYTIDGQKVYAAKAWVTDDLRLFEDDFYVMTATNNDVNCDITDRGARLKGFTAYANVIPYVCGGASWQQVLTNNNSYVRLYPNGAAYPASLTPDYNFKDTGRFRIEVETKAVTADYMVLACGSQYKTNQNPADGFAVRIYSNGMIQCYSQGSEIAGAVTNITTTTNYYVKIAVDTPPAFDGPGTAYFRVTVNDQPIDFNGAADGGRVYSRPCLTNNYITLGAYSATGGAPYKYGHFYSLKLFDDAPGTFVPTDEFAGVPVVLAQVETDYTTNAVVPRVCEVDANGFVVYLQPQETNALFTSDGYQLHSGEITGFVAIEQGSSISGKIQTGLQSGLANAAVNIPFSNKTTPRIFATLNTFNNPDPVILRHKNLTATGVSIFGQEETSCDTETTITPTETAGWMVIGQ